MFIYYEIMLSFILYLSYFHLKGLQIRFYLLSQCLMSISIDQCHAGIGLFFGQVCVHIKIKSSIGYCNLKVVIIKKTPIF